MLRFLCGALLVCGLMAFGCSDDDTTPTDAQAEAAVVDGGADAAKEAGVVTDQGAEALPADATPVDATPADGASE